MKRAFTLVEIFIVVALLGTLAAIVLPMFQDHRQQARESTAKENLRILRNAIGLYAVEHNNVPPGYPNDDPTKDPTFEAFSSQMVFDGKHLSELPKNPFNGETKIQMIENGHNFPSTNEGKMGWIYKALTKEIRLDWPGTDSAGIAYFDY